MGSVVIRYAAAGVVATVVCAGLLSAQPASASTGEELSASEAAQVVAEAVAVEGVPAATDAAEVTQTGQGVVSDVPNSPVSLVLPDAEVTGQTSSATVVDGAGDSQAVVQDVAAQGQRVAFIINSPTDPTEYRVDFDGAATLQLDGKGAVMVLGAQGQLLGLVSPPWARDANGTEVSTRFVVRGRTLHQQIDHRNVRVAYPVVADPFWIPALMVVATVTRHAAAQAAARGVSQALIKQVVQNGARSAGHRGTSVFAQGQGANRIRVVVDNKTGNIITVTKG